MSAPGPIGIICLDRGYEGMLRNPNPPPWRRTDVGFKIISIPSATTAPQSAFVEAWNTIRNEVYNLIQDPSVKVIGIDGDSDSYEIQRLAEFGRLDQVPPLMYGSVKLKRRAFVNRLNDSGKTIIATSKVKYDYEDKINKLTGQVVTDKNGEPIQTKTNRLITQGLNEEDRNYLWQIVIRHLYKPKTYNRILNKEIPGQFGLRILKCKPNMNLIGAELWGDDCNFKSLVSLVYPYIPLESWGF
jgi:hypothetical protein